MKAIHTIRAVCVALALMGCARSSTVSDPTLPPLASGSVTVTGRVVDSRGQPVSDARVYVPGAEAATRTDANGSYTLTGVPDGPQEVVARRSGFVASRVDAKFSTKPSDRARNRVNVTLLTRDEAAAVANQQARDSAALTKNGFLQRESSIKGGYFLAPDEIATTRAVTLTDLLSRIPVLIEVPGRTGPVLRGAQGCLVTYVDGLRWRTMFPGDINTYVPVNDVLAVEAYAPGTLAPLAFARPVPMNCTTLAVWTRSSVG